MATHVPDDDEMSESEEYVDNRLVYPTRHWGEIVNACTGWSYGFRMGDRRQDTLFQVRHCCGEYDALGNKSARGPPLKDPQFLFYDSPRQYLVQRARLLGMAGTQDDIQHLMRRGYSAQPPFDMAKWAAMTSRWQKRKALATPSEHSF